MEFLKFFVTFGLTVIIFFLFDWSIVCKVRFFLPSVATLANFFCLSYCGLVDFVSGAVGLLFGLRIFFINGFRS